jgi:hypothetical protein
MAQKTEPGKQANWYSELTTLLLDLFPFFALQCGFAPYIRLIIAPEEEERLESLMGCWSRMEQENGGA